MISFLIKKKKSLKKIIKDEVKTESKKIEKDYPGLAVDDDDDEPECAAPAPAHAPAQGYFRIPAEHKEDMYKLYFGKGKSEGFI